MLCGIYTMLFFDFNQLEKENVMESIVMVVIGMASAVVITYKIMKAQGRITLVKFEGLVATAKKGEGDVGDKMRFFLQSSEALGHEVTVVEEITHKRAEHNKEAKNARKFAVTTGKTAETEAVAAVNESASEAKKLRNKADSLEAAGFKNADAIRTNAASTVRMQTARAEGHEEHVNALNDLSNLLK